MVTSNPSWLSPTLSASTNDSSSSTTSTRTRCSVLDFLLIVGSSAVPAKRLNLHLLASPPGHCRHDFARRGARYLDPVPCHRFRAPDRDRRDKNARRFARGPSTVCRRLDP